MNKRRAPLLQPGRGASWARSGAAVLLALGALGGCDVQWGGVDVKVREPEELARPPVVEVALDTVVPAPPLELPTGPILFHVHRSDPAGRAVIEPVAELSPEELRLVGSREEARADEYAAEFNNRYFQDGQSYPLYGEGARVGTFYVEALATTGAGLCQTLRATGQLELRPSAANRDEFAAWAPGARSEADSLVTPAFRADMVTLAQVLARRGVTQRGIAGRWRFGSPADLRPLKVGRGPRGFAVTFMVRDALAVGSPSDSAGTVFLVADFDPARGYFPLYFDADWYGAGEKRALEWLDAVDLVGDPEREWLLQAYGDVATWYELVGLTDGARSVVWTSRRPLCEAQGPRNR